MDSRERVNLLYRRQAQPWLQGLEHSQIASPGNQQHSPPLGSPTQSTASSGSYQSDRFDSSYTSPSSVSSLSADRAMPPPSDGNGLLCEFGFLGCELRFPLRDVGLWIAHSRSHFLHHPPPSYTICTFCDDPTGRFQAQGDPEATWYMRMLHISRHFERHEREDRLRPDFYLVEYMWSIGLLSTVDYNEAMKHTERPHCKELGIVPTGYKPKERVLREAQESRVVHDHRKENRERQKSRKNHRDTQTRYPAQLQRREY